MSLKWKIFKTANIAEIILVTTLMALSVYSSDLSFKSTFDFFTFFVFVTICISISTNSFLNIHLLGFIITGEKMSARRKVVFWSLFVILFLAVILLILVLVKFYAEIMRTVPFKNSADFKAYGSFLWITVITTNACFILYLQVMLFYKIKNVSSKTETMLIDNIGTIGF